MLDQNPKQIEHENNVVNFSAQSLNGLHIFDFVTIKVNPQVDKKKIIRFIIN